MSWREACRVVWWGSGLLLLGSSGCFFPAFDAAEGSAGGAGGEATGGDPQGGAGGIGGSGGDDLWKGPSILVKSERVGAACPSGWNTERIGFEDPNGAPLVCSPCTCDTTGSLCPPRGLHIFGSQCDQNLINVLSVTPGSCSIHTATGSEEFTRVWAPANPMGSCFPIDPTPMVYPIPFDTVVSACGPPSGCQDLSCPEAVGQLQCLTRMGDYPCPPDYDDVRELFPTDFRETRTCPACSCAIGDMSCDNDVSMYRNGAVCTTGAPEIVGPAACTLVYVDASDTLEFWLPPEASQAQCPAQTGESFDTVLPTEPFTACCKSL